MTPTQFTLSQCRISPGATLLRFQVTVLQDQTLALLRPIYKIKKRITQQPRGKKTLSRLRAWVKLTSMAARRGVRVISWTDVFHRQPRAMRLKTLQRKLLPSLQPRQGTAQHAEFAMHTPHVRAPARVASSMTFRPHLSLPKRRYQTIAHP